MSTGLKQTRVILLPPLIEWVFSAPASSSSFETAQGNQPSGHLRDAPTEKDGTSHLPRSVAHPGSRLRFQHRLLPVPYAEMKANRNLPLEKPRLWLLPQVETASAETSFQGTIRG